MRQAAAQGALEGIGHTGALAAQGVIANANIHPLECGQTHSVPTSVQAAAQGVPEGTGQTGTLAAQGAFANAKTSQPGTASLPGQQSAVARGADPLAQVGMPPHICWPMHKVRELRLRALPGPCSRARPGRTNSSRSCWSRGWTCTSACRCQPRPTSLGAGCSLTMCRQNALLTRLCKR